MSRPIKFRLWDKFTSSYEEMTLSEAFMGTPLVIDERFEVEQDTGLKDKNGEKICEGDIVEYDWYIVGNKPAYRVSSVVKFDYKGAMAGNNRLWKCTNVEVIGNIHENPELLGGKK